MSWKRVVAREWLYLLGFAVGSFLLATAVFYMARGPVVEQPIRMPSPIERNRGVFEKHLAVGGEESIGSTASLLVDIDLEEMMQGRLSVSGELGKCLNDSERNAFDSLKLLLSENPAYFTLPDTVLTRQRDSLRVLGLRRWIEQYDNHQAYNDRVMRADWLQKVTVFSLYPFFLFLRTIVWAVRQVRKKPKSK
ncbi:MAG: hypothetical protein KOO62_09170 [candidate division Zixibacteria bacterium]|nr:hypothetical protein [candidate division Zixibacteria bacterium]